MSATDRKSIGIFGGTFDPVHRGHTQLAEEIRQHVPLDEMRLLPCRLPPHRDAPLASVAERLAMLELAIVGTSLQIDAREFTRSGPSYTIDTLTSLREECGEEAALVLCMGEDAFAGLASWHRWQELPLFAHILVVKRPGTSMDPRQNLSAQLKSVLDTRQTTDPAALKKSAAGLIYLTQLSQIPVSSTQIRQQLADGVSPVTSLHPAVYQFIQQRGLYQNR